MATVSKFFQFGATGYRFIFSADEQIPDAVAKLAIDGIQHGPSGMRAAILFTRKLQQINVGDTRATYHKDASMISARRAAAQIIRQSRAN